MGSESIEALNEAAFVTLSKLPSSFPVVAVEPKVISASADNFKFTAHGASAAHFAVAAIVGVFKARPVTGVKLLPTTVMEISRAPLTLA
ncbi:unannotated protein [freshwater metagenome]|uniref:Unannotated protein n=1 Tax=freshwater metagenome TaxID=449393 RepID=A0A6J7RKD9_9ZZZZ